MWRGSVGVWAWVCEGAARDGYVYSRVWILYSSKESGVETRKVGADSVGDQALRKWLFVTSIILQDLHSTFYYPSWSQYSFSISHSFVLYFPIPTYSRPLATPSEWNLDKKIGKWLRRRDSAKDHFPIFIKFYSEGVAGGRPDLLLNTSSVTDARHSIETWSPTEHKTLIVHQSTSAYRLRAWLVLSREVLRILRSGPSQLTPFSAHICFDCSLLFL